MESRHLSAFEDVLDRQDFDLARAALLAVGYEYPNLDPYPCLTQLDRMADDVRPRLADRETPRETIRVLSQHIFDDLGFRGNREDYYDPENSHLNRVLDRRVGIPITLSLVVLEVAWRLDLPMAGVGMPGHFLVKWAGRDGGEVLVDPFDDGEILTRDDAQDRVDEIFERKVTLTDDHLRSISKREMLTRLLNNLKKIHLEEGQQDRALQVLDRLLVVNPYSFQDLRDRGLVHRRLGHDERAVEDLERYLELLPGADDADEVRQVVERLQSSS